MCSWEVRPKVWTFEKESISLLLWFGEKGHFVVIMDDYAFFCLNFLRGSIGTFKVVGEQSCQTNTKIRQW
jgi:hypothetical protein